MKDPTVLLCLFMCVYPLLIFGLPAFLIGRFWGRIKLKSPIEVQPEIQARINPAVAAKQRPPQVPVSRPGDKFGT